MFASRAPSHEAILGIVSLRMANREGVRIASWLNHWVQMKNSGLRQQRYQLIFTSVNGLVFGLSRAAVVGLPLANLAAPRHLK